jgi:hypothetical protein
MVMAAWAQPLTKPRGFHGRNDQVALHLPSIPRSPAHHDNEGTKLARTAGRPVSAPSNWRTRHPRRYANRRARGSRAAAHDRFITQASVGRDRRSAAAFGDVMLRSSSTMRHFAVTSY